MVSLEEIISKFMLSGNFGQLFKVGKQVDVHQNRVRKSAVAQMPDAMMSEGPVWRYCRVPDH